MKKIIFFIILALSFGTLIINYYWLIEAYGSGAPYYSGTTNMDKWSNPVPVLFILDISIVILVYLGISYIKKSTNKRSRLLLKQCV